MTDGQPLGLGAAASWSAPELPVEHNEWILYKTPGNFVWSRQTQRESHSSGRRRALAASAPSSSASGQQPQLAGSTQGTKRARDETGRSPFLVVAASPAKRPARAGEPPPPLLLAFLEGGLQAAPPGQLPGLSPKTMHIDTDSSDDADTQASPFSQLRSTSGTPSRRPLQGRARLATGGDCPSQSEGGSCFIPGIIGHIITFLSLPEALVCAEVSKAWDAELGVSSALEWVDLGRYFRGHNHPDPCVLYTLSRRIAYPMRCLSLAYCAWAGCGDVLMLLGLRASLSPSSPDRLTGVAAHVSPPASMGIIADSGGLTAPGQPHRRQLLPPSPPPAATPQAAQPPGDSTVTSAPAAAWYTPASSQQDHMDTSQVSGTALSPGSPGLSAELARKVLDMTVLSRTDTAEQQGMLYAHWFVEAGSGLPCGSLGAQAAPPPAPGLGMHAGEAMQLLQGCVEPALKRTLGGAVAMNACWQTAQLDFAAARAAWRQAATSSAPVPAAWLSSGSNQLPTARFCAAALDVFGPWYALHAVQAALGSGIEAARATAALLATAWKGAAPPADPALLPAVPIIRTQMPLGVHPQDMADAASERFHLYLPKATAGAGAAPTGALLPTGALPRLQEHWLMRPLPMGAFVSPVTVLDLAGCVGLHTDNLPLLAAYTPHLRNLRLTGCNQLQPEHLTRAIAMWPALTHVDLDYAERCVTDAVLHALGGHCPNLRRLYITGAQAVTDAAFSVDEGLLSGCPHLATLKLTGCRELTDVSLRSIALRCRSLEDIALGGVRQLTASALAELLVSCPALTRIKAEMWLDAQPVAIRQRQAASVGDIVAAAAAVPPAGMAAATAEQDTTSYRVVRNIDSALRYLARVLPPGHVASKPLLELRAHRGITDKAESLMVLHDDHLVRQLDRHSRGRQ